MQLFSCANFFENIFFDRGRWECKEIVEDFAWRLRHTRRVRQLWEYRAKMHSYEIINVIICFFKVLMNSLRSVVFVPRNDKSL